MGSVINKTIDIFLIGARSLFYNEKQQPKSLPTIEAGKSHYHHVLSNFSFCEKKQRKQKPVVEIRHTRCVYYVLLHWRIPLQLPIIQWYNVQV